MQPLSQISEPAMLNTMRSKNHFNYSRRIVNGEEWLGDSYCSHTLTHHHGKSCLYDRPQAEALSLPNSLVWCPH